MIEGVDPAPHFLEDRDDPVMMPPSLALEIGLAACRSLASPCADAITLARHGNNVVPCPNSGPESARCAWCVFRHWREKRSWNARGVLRDLMRDTAPAVWPLAVDYPWPADAERVGLAIDELADLYARIFGPCTGKPSPEQLETVIHRAVDRAFRTMELAAIRVDETNQADDQDHMSGAGATW